MNFNLDPCEDSLPEIQEAIQHVIRNRQFILGPHVSRFERDWAEYNQMPYCIGVGNGTDAIRIALLALGVKPGDEVISPAHNVAYTALAVASIGAKNVYVDVDPNTMLMDLDDTARAITDRTRVILPVHLYGQMVDMERFAQLARGTGVLLVEDAAQAHGSTFKGCGPGWWSDAACFSHYPTKNLGAWGEAGSIVTRSPIVNERARLLRDGGRTDRYVHTLPGINSCLDEMQAAILTVKLPWLAKMNAQRRSLALRYREALAYCPIQFQHTGAYDYEVDHLFVVRLYSPHAREPLMENLSYKGIPSLIHYPLILPHQPFAVADALGQGPWPISERIANSCLSLPLYPGMPTEEQDAVIAAVKEFFGVT